MKTLIEKFFINYGYPANFVNIKSATDSTVLFTIARDIELQTLQDLKEFTGADKIKIKYNPLNAEQGLSIVVSKFIYNN